MEEIEECDCDDIGVEGTRVCEVVGAGGTIMEVGAPSLPCMYALVAVSQGRAEAGLGVLGGLSLGWRVVDSKQVHKIKIWSC